MATVKELHCLACDGTFGPGKHEGFVECCECFDAALCPTCSSKPDVVTEWTCGAKGCDDVPCLACQTESGYKTATVRNKAFPIFCEAHRIECQCSACFITARRCKGCPLFLSTESQCVDCSHCGCVCTACTPLDEIATCAMCASTGCLGCQDEWVSNIVWPSDQTLKCSVCDHTATAEDDDDRLAFTVVESTGAGVGAGVGAGSGASPAMKRRRRGPKPKVVHYCGSCGSSCSRCGNGFPKGELDEVYSLCNDCNHESTTRQLVEESEPM